MNQHKLYANSILIFHVLVIVINLATLPIIFLFPSLRIPAVAFIALTPLVWILGKGCFLTNLENEFRAKYDKEHTYQIPCLVHYVKKWFGLKITNLQIILFLYAYFVLVIYSAIVLMRMH